MSKLKENTSLQILFFLAIFGFSCGLFSDYRELWLNSNGITAGSISKIICISSIVTVLVLIFFTLKVSTDKLKKGISISLILSLIAKTVLILLNNKNCLFIIKFTMFFEIAFTELILSSIYPLIISVKKSDLVYTKKGVVESLSDKMGFLVVSILLGKVIFGKVVDYNTCCLLSAIFLFISIIVFLNIKINSKKQNELNIKDAIDYFKHNKVYLHFLLTLFLGGMVWSIIWGMPLLTLTTKLNMSSKSASLIILSLGIISNFLAILIVKYFRFKNDHINLMFKYGIRLVLYLLVFLIGTKEIYLIMIVYLLLTDCPYGFIFSSYFIHNIKEEYSLLLTVLKYCANLIGNGLGTLICGLVFGYDIKYLTIFAILVGIIHYICATILINKKSA